MTALVSRAALIPQPSLSSRAFATQAGPTRSSPAAARPGTPFRSFEVEGREATLVHVGDITLSPLVFELEHERARRVQLAQTGEREFELRIDATDETAAETVFQEVDQSVQRVFRDNGLADVVVRQSRTPPEFTASGKFHEVLPLRTRKHQR